MSSRVGLGFDVHPFSADDAGARTLILGGVVFADERPLAGHSDADVVAHAIADAVLGAAGLGDIGMHFPDNDDRWQGADSLHDPHRVCEIGACRGLPDHQCRLHDHRRASEDCPIPGRDDRTVDCRRRRARRRQSDATRGTWQPRPWEGIIARAWRSHCSVVSPPHVRDCRGPRVASL